MWGGKSKLLNEFSSPVDPRWNQKILQLIKEKKKFIKMKSVLNCTFLHETNKEETIKKLNIYNLYISLFQNKNIQKLNKQMKKKFILEIT